VSLVGEICRYSMPLLLYSGSTIPDIDVNVSLDVTIFVHGYGIATPAHGKQYVTVL
jgi:hypothetical protein